MPSVTACLTFLCLAACLQTAVSQLVKAGGCPRLDVKQSFDLQEYLGTWYQRASFGTALFQGVGKCVTAVYSRNPGVDLVKVYNRQLALSGGTISSITGVAEQRDPEKMEGKLLVSLPVPVLGYITAPYWILDTDYNSWAVVYSCLDLSLAHITSGWILTRVQDLDASETMMEVEEQVASALERAGLSRDLFIDTDQSDCNIMDKLSEPSEPSQKQMV